MSDIETGGVSSRSPAQVDEQLQHEIDQALQGQDVEAMIEQSVAPQAEADSGGEPAPGATEPQSGEAPEFHHEIRRGRISAIRGEDVFVELTGEIAKLQGIVPLAQFDRPPRLGSIMDFVVDRVDEGQGLMYLSREGAVSRATWEQLQPGAVVEARVVATNKGGLELEMVGGTRAFMPASQIDLHHVGELEPLIGEKLEATVQEINRKSKKVVLSRRVLLQQRRARAKKKLLEELEEGQIREGKVSSVVDFGAFVDLGGVDGLIHVTDLSYTHVDKPAEVVKVGQSVRIKVLKIDREQERIGLGLKQVEPDPWENITSRVQVGETLAVRVLRTANFGAFGEIEPGVEGLLPLSELSWTRIHKADEVVTAGQVVRAQVLSLDGEKRRLSLSVKQAQGDPWTGAAGKFEKDAQIEGKVISTTDFGAFVELEPGVEGMVHISELADRRVGNVEEVVKAGDVKTFRVLEADESHHRIRLSLREQGDTRAGTGGPKDGAAHPGGQPHKPGKPGKPTSRKPRGDLKGGMDPNAGLGVGLGGLSLDQFK